MQTVARARYAGKFNARERAVGRTPWVVAIAVLCQIQSLSSVAALPASAARSMLADFEPAGMLERVAVLGRDERRLVIGRRPELRERIGVLHHRGTGAVCSAFCVAADVIATAGHCVPRPETESQDINSDLSFKRDVDPLSAAVGIASASEPSRASAVMTGAVSLQTRPPINATSDWAFLRLERSACSAGGLRMSPLSKTAIAARAKEGRVFHVAYHRDMLISRLVIARPCRILTAPSGNRGDTSDQDFENPGQLLLHTCDTDAASSGSPLLTDGPKGPEVVGINVGTYVRSRVITSDGEIVQRLSSETIANTALAVAPLIPKLLAFEKAGADLQTTVSTPTPRDRTSPYESNRSTPRVTSTISARATKRSVLLLPSATTRRPSTASTAPPQP